MRFAHLALALLALHSLEAQSFGTQLFVAGLQRPVYVGSPPADHSRVMVIEQLAQRIRLVKDGVLLATPFLTVPTASTAGNERGMLGLAFHPDYTLNGQFFVYYTDTVGNIQIARYVRSATNPDVANPMGTTLFSVTQTLANHNGGCLAFGPDGFLWIGIGDGGPSSNGQNRTVQFGKLLRIDVNTPSGGLIWSNPASNPYVGATAGHDSVMHYGLRNPWRFSFDRWSGDLWIGDVGNAAVEEIDFLAAGTPGGRNFGWSCWEGNTAYSPGGCAAQSTMDAPLHEYTHSINGTCVIGGHVYRGNAIEGLQGTYFFSDCTSAKIWSLRRSASGSVSQFTDRTTQLDPPGTLSIATVSSFGEDAAGELYICDLYGGEIFKLMPTAPSAAALLVRTTPPQLGTSINFTLNSTTDPLKSWVFAFAGGSLPGTPLPDGRIIPVNLDAISNLALAPGSPFFPNNYGVLSAAGSGNASVLLPVYPPLVGMTLHGVFVVLDPASPFMVNQISNPLSMTLF